MSKPRYTGNDHVVDTAEGHILAPFEVLDRLNAAATLATRLAAVERERDALREVFRRLLIAVEVVLADGEDEDPFAEERAMNHLYQLNEVRLEAARALLGKETTDETTPQTETR